MNNPGHATKSSTSGPIVKYETSHQYDEGDVGQSSNTHTCDKVVLYLRGSGRGGPPTRAGFSRSHNRHSRSLGHGRGRQGGEQTPASESHAQSEPHEAAQNADSVTGNSLPALGANAEAANRGSSPHNAPTSYPLRSTLPEPHSSPDPGLLAQPDVEPRPLQPARADSSLSIGSSSGHSSELDSEMLSRGMESQESGGYVDRETNVHRQNWLDVFPFNYIRDRELPDNEWDFWSEQQEQAPDGIPADGLADLVESQQHGNLLGLGSVSSWAIREWVERTEGTRRQQRFNQTPEGIAARQAIERWVDSTEASRAEMGQGDEVHDPDQNDATK